MKKKSKNRKYICRKTVGPPNFLKIHSITLLTAKQKTKNKTTKTETKNKWLFLLKRVMNHEFEIRNAKDDY